jgi:hypothetical protein
MDDDKWVNQEGRLSENELGLLLQKEGGECDDRYSSQVLFAYRLLILFSKIPMDVNGVREFFYVCRIFFLVWILLEKYDSGGSCRRNILRHS